MPLEETVPSQPSYNCRIISWTQSTSLRGRSVLFFIQSNLPNFFYHLQAALVPFNRTDIASQIYASLFATLTIPPDPSAGVSEEPNPDMVLSLVRDHVKKGNIENALTTLSQNQMDNNQLAFTIGDWQRGANDRVAVEKVLRVIKMECALLNAELAGKGTHAEQ